MSDCFSERYGSFEGTSYTPSKVAYPLKRTWRLPVKGSWPMIYHPCNGTIIGAAGKKSGIAAWSFNDGKELWTRNDINFGCMPEYTIFRDLIHIKHQGSSSPNASLWIDRRTGDTMVNSFKNYIAPQGTIAGKMLVMDPARGVRVVDIETCEDVSWSSEDVYASGPLHVIEGDLVGQLRCGKFDLRPSRLSRDTSEFSWRFEYTGLNVVHIEDIYGLLSPSPSSSNSYNSIVNLVDGTELWQLPPRRPFFRCDNSVYMNAEQNILICMCVPEFDTTTGVICKRLSSGDPVWEHQWDRADGSGALFVTGDLAWLVEPVEEKKRELVARTIADGEEVYRLRLTGSKARVEWIEDGKILVRCGNSLCCYEPC